jgi:hypothetical protein
MPTQRKYSSRSQQTTLTSAVSSGATTIVVGSGSGLLGGATVTSPEIFTVVIDPDTALEEIVDVTAVSTNSLTVVRGRDGSSGQAHSAGAVVRHMAIGRDYREANEHINDTTTAHGVTGAVVGTTSTQTLTNKTLTSPKINENVALTATSTELNILDGVTASAAELNILDGVTASAAELNILDGVTASAAELNILDGATLSVTELNYVDGVTSAIQTQIDTKAPIASPTFTGTVTLPTSAVTSTMIADSAVTSIKIADGTIVAGDIADGAITSAKILDGTIVAEDLADGAVTSAKILNGTIANDDINASAGITYGKLTLTGGIVNTDIANGAAISLGKLSSDPLARANHTGTQTASTISDFDTQVRTSRLDQMAAPTAAVSVNSQKITSLATPTADTDASTKLYVDTSINNLIDGAPSTLDTLNEIAAALADTANFSDTVVLKAGSTMTGALTLSGAPTVDLHAATKLYVDAVAGSATAAASSATAAEAAYDSFDDRYLGAKSAAPTLDNDGNALITGALYWNTPAATMFAWDGSGWGSISSTAAIFRYKYTAAGGETSESGLDDNGITLSYIAGKEQVYLNGILLVRGTDYTASNGTSIDSLAALAASDVLEIITFTAFDLATAIDKSLFDAKGDILVATAADTPGKLTAGVDGYVLKANSATATGLEWAAVTDQTPLTTKGDLFTFSTVDARIEVGANDTVLTADSSAATGLKWAAVSGGYANYEVFNSSTTWTVPAGITKCAVYGVNGGAGGASGAALSGASNVGGAGGGFGVLFADPFFTVTPAASITVTIGGGGAGGVSASLSGSIAGGSANPSSFGALTSAYAIVANTGRAFKNVMTEIGAVGNAGAAGVAGGSLGAGGAAGAIGYTGSGGAGGGATNTPTSVAGSAGNLGAGGGGGGAGNAANATTTGGAGGAAGANTGAGGGGGGGAAAAGSAANRFGGNGGNGGSGVIVILY